MSVGAEYFRAFAGRFSSSGVYLAMSFSSRRIALASMVFGHIMSELAPGVRQNSNHLM